MKAGIIMTIASADCAEPDDRSALHHPTVVSRHTKPRSGWSGRLMTALSLWQQRRRLATLDDDALEDIGVSRTEAQMEAARPIWDVPAGWLR